MGFIKKVPPACECQKPPSQHGSGLGIKRLFGPGTIWECDNCGTRWVFQAIIASGTLFGKPVESPTDYWKEISPCR